MSALPVCCLFYVPGNVCIFAYLLLNLWKFCTRILHGRRAKQGPKLIPQILLKIQENPWKGGSKSIQHPKNGAQERSESDLGSMSPKEPKGRDEINEFFAPLGRFWVSFGAQLGAKGLPKSSFLAQSRTKISKNEAQNEASKNIWNFDWNLMRKCEILDVLNPPKCFV